jgi:zinc protease
VRLPVAFLLSALVLLAGPAAHAQAPLPQGVTRGTSVEGITEYNLPNGLRVLFAPEPSKPTTTVNTTYLVGSRHENYGETGMAHLLEHLVFKGSPNFKNGMGEQARRGLDFNGTTGTDRTNYYASFSANDDNLDWYLRWSAEAMTKSFIAKKDLDSEMTVVRNEMESGENNPLYSLFFQSIATAYQWHNYGKTAIGARADVENVKIDRLQAFYRKYYQPDNAVLIIAGKFDEAKTLGLIAKAFGAIPRPKRKLEPTYTVDPQQQGEKSVTLRRVGDNQFALAMYHMPPGPHPDFAAVELLTTVMGDTPSGRLHKALVESKQAASIFGGAFDWREPTIAYFGAQLPTAGDLEAARATLIATLEGVTKNPVTDAEVERARAKYLKDFDLRAADPQKVGVALSGAIAQGDWRLFFLQRDRVRNAKTADVQRVAVERLMPANRTLGLFIPTGSPQRPPLPALVDAAPMVKDYKGDPAVVVGEAFEASPANIEKRTERTKLANGMKVALLPKRTRAAAVSARLVLRFGDEKSLAGTPPLGTVTAAMVNRGAAGMTRTEIQDTFDKLKARVSFDGTATALVVTVQTSRENLPEVMKLVAKALRSPDFPATELEQYRNERLADLEAERREPDDLARNALARHGNPYPKGDPRHVTSFDEAMADMRAVTLEQVRAFHKDFYGSGATELAAVGDFDAAALKAQLTELFGGWTAAKPYGRVPNPLYAMPAGEQRLETPDKANAFFTARVRFPLKDDAPDYAAALVANRIVGAGTDSILWKRVREKEGVSYGIGSGVQASSHEAHGLWTVSAIYAPQNVGKLEAAIKQEFARLAREGFTAKELQDAKNGLLQARRLALAQDAGLAATLAGQLEVGRTMDYVAGVDKAIAAVTLEQANAAFRKYVDVSKLAIFYAGDWTKK